MDTDEKPTILTASNARVAINHTPYILLGSLFPILYALAIQPADHIPAWAKTVFAAAAIFGLGLAIHGVFKIIRTLRAGGAWRATIDDNMLTWETALAHPTFPLHLDLSQIKDLAVLETWTTGADNDTFVTTTYEIHLSDGEIIDIRHEDAGLDPHRVFLALNARGIPYHQWTRDIRDDPQANRILERSYEPPTAITSP